jgi:DNA-binding MarR family transcriptional regulator
MLQAAPPRNSRTAQRHTPAGEAFTHLILEVFRLNGCLLAAGDRLTRDLGLTSARWQILGAIDDGPLPVAQIARNMGLTRQAVQRVANDLAAEGFVAFAHNPNHQRAKLVGLTPKGRQALDEINQRQAGWANRIATAPGAATLNRSMKILRALRTELETNGLAGGEDVSCTR